LPKKYGVSVTSPQPPPIPLTEVKRFLILLILVFVTPIVEEGEKDGMLFMVVNVFDAPVGIKLPADGMR
jgi:hypothetical protein